MSVRLPAICSFLAVLVLASTSVVADKPNWRDGRKVFKQCSSCHTFKAGDHRFGPSLSGFYGRQAATAPNFPYSDAMKAKGSEGLVWEAKTLDPFLTSPKAFIPDTKMSYKGLSSEQDRRNVIAYIKRRSKR